MQRQISQVFDRWRGVLGSSSPTARRTQVYCPTCPAPASQGPPPFSSRSSSSGPQARWSSRKARRGCSSAWPSSGDSSSTSAAIRRPSRRSRRRIDPGAAGRRATKRLCRFNFTDTSPNASTLGNLGMVDAHPLAGFGRGTTWPVHRSLAWMPRLRLNHIYPGSGLAATECRTGEGAGSDHRPVIARIGFAR